MACTNSSNKMTYEFKKGKSGTLVLNEWRLAITPSFHYSHIVQMILFTFFFKKKKSYPDYLRCLIVSVDTNLATYTEI